MLVRACGATPYSGLRPSDPVLLGSGWLDHAEGAACMLRGTALDGVLSEGYWRGVSGVGDSQTEAEGVPSKGGRGEALLGRTLYTGPDLIV